jgi:hypothetical protein
MSDLDHAGTGTDSPQASADLLAEIGALRRGARQARHAYWFPLVLFGLLICASLPFYLQIGDLRNGVYTQPVPLWPALGGEAPGSRAGTDCYWLAALAGGVAISDLWYWWHARRAGLAMAHRAALITLAALTLLAALLPWDPATYGGTLPLVLIGIGLLVLARTERSRGLAVIAVLYTVTAVTSTLYDFANPLGDLGWYLPARTSGLPNEALPAAILLIAGAGALVARQWPRRAPGQRLSGRLGAAA